MEDNKQNMLGTESIGKLLFKMSAPAILAQIINILYNIVDRIFIGRIPEVGSLALTGVGVTFPIIIIIAAFASLIGMGGAPKASIKMGANEYDDAEEILGNCFASLIFISIILTVLFLIFHEKILLIFGATENTIQYSKDYIQIYILGIIFVQIALGLNMFISSQGFPKISMQTVLIGAILNIILDFIFIKILNFGVKGAALATVISQAVSSIWVLIFLTSSKSKIKIKKKYFKVKKQVILPVMALGVSPFIMQSTESLLNLAFNFSLKKYGGDMAVGTMTILSTLMQCINLPAIGLGQGAQPIISFNFGAGNKDRVKKTFRLLLISSLTFTILAWGFIMIDPKIFIEMFAKKGDPLVDYASNFLRVYLFGVFILGGQFACQQTFVALGQAKTSLFLALFRKIILLIPLIFILPLFIKNSIFAVFLAEPIADIISTITSMILFMITSKKIYKSIESRET